jgi:hypothetical protein
MSVLTVKESVRVLQDLRDSRLRLISPLYVTIEQEDDTIVANNADLDVFGYGATETEALQDLREIIVETYFDLKRDSDRLGAHLRAIWAYLDRIVLEIQDRAA